MNDDFDAKVRERAYAIWERENRPEGKHLDHWLCAQSEIEAEQSSAGDQPASVQTASAGDAAEPASEAGGGAKKRSN
jgi:hypothetical protein